MADNRQRLVHLHTSDVKIPAQGLLNLGEIAVQHNDVEAALYIEKTNGEIAKFIDVTAVEAKIEVEKLRAEGAEEALSDRIDTLSGSNHTHENKDVLDGITAEKVAAWDAAEANAIADAEAKYQVKGEYEVAGAAAQALADAKSYSDGLNNAMDERVDALEGSNHTHANKAELDKIAEGDKAKWDDAVSRLDNFLVGTGTADVVDTLQDIKNWMDGDGVVATELTKAIAAEAKLRGDADDAMDARVKVLEGYNHDAYIAADAQILTDAKAYVDGKVDGKFDAVGAAAQALADAKADAADKYQAKGEYEAAGAAAQALADAKAYVDGKVDGKFDEVGAAAQALTDAKGYTDEKLSVIKIDCGTY